MVQFEGVANTKTLGEKLLRGGRIIMYKCPKCGEETISKFSKFMLGPGRAIRCSNCNSKVSVSWWTWIIFMLVFSGLWILKEFIDPRITMILTVIVMSAYLYIHMYFIPLKTRKEKNVK